MLDESTKWINAIKRICNFPYLLYISVTEKYRLLHILTSEKYFFTEVKKL
jgi:hypothetical protein